MNDLYKPAQIAAVIGFTPETVRSYLALKFPLHQHGAWWRLERAEYDLAVAEMRAANEVSPGQPLRALRRSQQLIPFF